MTKSKKKREQEKTLTNAHNDHQKGMKSYTLFKLNNKAMSEDLVQDTFLKTWRYLVKEGKIDLMKPFLYHVLNRLIIDEYRKKYRKHTVSSLDILLEKGFEPSVDHLERMVDTFDGKAAMRLIHKLPKKYEKIIRMRYVQNLSLKEISVLTGQKKNTVAVQSHRGLEKLKKLHNPT